MVEELARDDRADRVAADVLGAARAQPVPIEPGQRVGATRVEFAAEDIALRHAPVCRERRPRGARPGGAGLCTARRYRGCVTGTSDARNPREHDAPEVGIGPYVGPPLDGDHWDPDLLARGDRRNVEDRYRYWRLDAIVADLDTRRHGFHVAIENWGHDFNIGSVVRTANAFNAKAFHIIGKRRWNRRGAMVTDRYQHEVHHPDVPALAAWAAEQPRDGGGSGIPLIGIDNVPGSVALETYDLPRECVLVFGQEGPGLSPEMLAVCREVLHIEQFGSTRSINAGAAAAIAMHSWIRLHVHGQGPRDRAPTRSTS